MEMYCPECRKVFENEDYLICPYCGTSLKSRVGRQPIPRELRHKVFQRDNYRCRECGATNKETTLEIDHIIPVAEGGTNDINNLQTLCKECNRAKLTDEWVGGQNSLEALKKELDILQDRQLELNNIERDYLSEDEVLDHDFTLKVIEERIIELEKLIIDKEIKIEQKNKEIEIKNKERKAKEILYKKLYLTDDEILNYLYGGYNIPSHLVTKQEKLNYLIKKLPYYFEIPTETTFKLINYLESKIDDKFIIKLITTKILDNTLTNTVDVDKEIKIELIEYVDTQIISESVKSIIKEKINDNILTNKEEICVEIEEVNRNTPLIEYLNDITNNPDIIDIITQKIIDETITTKFQISREVDYEMRKNN